MLRYLVLIPFWGMAQVLYRLYWAQEDPFTYKVEVLVSASAGKYTDFRMPAWRPGRYILQNYAGAVYDFWAYGPTEKPLPWKKIDKDTWRVFHGEQKPVRISYRVYARTLDAGSSYVGPGLIYFNPITLFVYASEFLNKPCQLELPDLPLEWQVATALSSIAPRRYQATSYHELVDAPFVIAPSLRQAQTTCEGVTLYVHFWGQVGAQMLDGFLNDLCRIVRAQKAIWGEIPLKFYHFIYILVPFSMRHAVEHENCAVFVLPQSGAQSEEALQSFLGISAHEFFHVWNVKRLRPAVLWPYDYNKPPATSLHWLTEGVTDYYTGLTLARAGIWSEETFWEETNRFLSVIENQWVYRAFSPAELSIDSWLATSSYRPGFLQGSFYVAGRRVGLLLDLFLRRESGGRLTLDTLMRYLYEQYYKRGRGLPEEGVEAAMRTLLGRGKASTIRRFWVDVVEGRKRLSYREFATGLPLEVEEEVGPAPGWGRVGLRVRPEGEGLLIEEVVPGSLAAKAGLCSGDFLLTVEGQAASKWEPQWDQLRAGAKLALGWNRQDLPMEGVLTYDPSRAELATKIRLRPTLPGFLTRH